MTDTQRIAYFSAFRAARGQGLSLAEARAHAATIAKAKEDDAPPDEAARLEAEDAMLALFGAYAAAQLKRLRAALGEGGTLGINWDAEALALVRQVLPFYRQTLATAAEAATTTLGIGVDWALVNDAVLDLAKAETQRLARQATDTTRAQAAKIVAGWVETGGTLEDLADQLEALYPPARARMIAATEVTKLYAKGNQAAWQASGVVKGLKWQTAQDDRVCPICGPRAGRVLPLDEAEDIPPAHPSCRCWITPVVMSERELAER